VIQHGSRPVVTRQWDNQTPGVAGPESWRL